MSATFSWLELKEGLRCLFATCPIIEQDPKKLQLIDWDEIKTFKTQKRSNEHLSARWLLEQALAQWGGIDCSQLSISRTDERAPYLQAIQGLWIQPKLPSISISHSEGLACVALIDHGWTVGIDAEPLSRPPNPSVYDMMAKGEELTRLKSGDLDALRAWTSKEAVQKAARLGMHLNPRDIVLSSSNKENKIPIENLILQLENLSNNEYRITLAWGRDIRPIRTSEDELLDATREAMNSGDDWTVGCSTIRKNA
ncbi:MAG: Uncharacterised protein [Euryarchaeota archaeon UBA443]|nr:MAG: Uncharacterised protein [Euryarchaeota archaeon UBA443]